MAERDSCSSSLSVFFFFLFFINIENPKDNTLLRWKNAKDLVKSQGGHQKRTLTF